MIELFLVRANDIIEIPTQSITWSGQRYKSARKIMANILYTDKGGHQYTKVEEGDTVLFKWNEKELFRGTVFSKDRTKSGTLSLVAYDMLHHLLLSKDIYVFENKRATDIVTRICKDFQIPYGAMANTSVRLNEIFQNETTLYDIILRSLVNTEKESGRRFRIASNKGSLNLKEVAPDENQWVLETGVNIINYSYTTSIEETATRVKMIAGEEKDTITVSVTDSSGQKKYGVLQHFERVTEKVNKSQLTSMAKNTLNKKKGIQKHLEVDALGIDEITSNMPIYVIENDISVKGTYYVDTDSHFFQGERHDMKLKLLEENTLPEVNV
ncbi:XkdQ/YqbQ family protein [Oceanobacillus sp. CF4.6]|uniref:XkdQ/YqbQ family protein n=1 Tax=Oceanobacillus sp. CF4.6 TaxID=3373080 RepID=UPI003EE5A500